MNSEEHEETDKEFQKRLAEEAAFFYTPPMSVVSESSDD